MNNVKDSIGWADYTWNPITGCKGGCEYCYAKKMYHRQGWSFEPTFHPERLYEPRNRQLLARIFCGSVTDFWGEGVKQDWRDKVYAAMAKTPHTFFLLTKQPQNIPNDEPIPDNCWVGVSVTGPKDLWRLVDLNIKTLQTERSFVSIEPLLADVDDWGILFDVGWIIVGGLSPKAAHKNEWVDKIIAQASSFNIPLYLKANLHYPKIIKEFPKC